MINYATIVNKPLGLFGDAKRMRLYFYCFWLPTTVSGGSALAAKSAPHTIALILLAIGLLGLFDGICRFKEALRLKHCRLTDRHFRLFSQSMCQRNMIIGLAGKRASAYYQRIGYRWYHLLPDILLREPIRFFSPAFLRKNFWPL